MCHIIVSFRLILIPLSVLTCSIPTKTTINRGISIRPIIDYPIPMDPTRPVQSGPLEVDSDFDHGMDEFLPTRWWAQDVSAWEDDTLLAVGGVRASRSTFEPDLQVRPSTSRSAYQIAMRHPVAALVRYRSPVDECWEPLRPFFPMFEALRSLYPALAPAWEESTRRLLAFGARMPVAPQEEDVPSTSRTPSRATTSDQTATTTQVEATTTVLEETAVPSTERVEPRSAQASARPVTREHGGEGSRRVKAQRTVSVQVCTRPKGPKEGVFPATFRQASTQTRWVDN